MQDTLKDKLINLIFANDDTIFDDYCDVIITHLFDVKRGLVEYFVL